MNKKEKREALYFVFWGIGFLGVALLFLFSVDMVKYFFFEKAILWSREVVVPLLGLMFYLLSRKLISNLKDT